MSSGCPALSAGLRIRRRQGLRHLAELHLIDDAGQVAAVLGIDVGGTKILAGRVGRSGPIQRGRYSLTVVPWPTSE